MSKGNNFNTMKLEKGAIQFHPSPRTNRKYKRAFVFAAATSTLLVLLVNFGWLFPQSPPDSVHIFNYNVADEPANDSLYDPTLQPGPLVNAKSINSTQYAKGCDTYTSLEFVPRAKPRLLCGSDDSLAAVFRFEVAPSAKSNLLETQRDHWTHSELIQYFENFKKRSLAYDLPPLKQHLDYLALRNVTPLPATPSPPRHQQSNPLQWSTGSSIQYSHIQCGTVEESISQRYCDTRNVALNLDSLPKVSDRNKGQDLPAPFGTMKARCYLDQNDYFGRGFGGGAGAWMYNAMDILPPKETNEINCDIWLDTPVFFISRWDTTNPYQFHQDVFNTFIVYSLLNLAADSNIQPVLLDRRDSDGPYTAAWSHFFTSSQRLVDIRQLAETAKRQWSKSHDGIPWPHERSPRLCFKKAVFGIHGGISPLSRGGMMKSQCKDAPLLLAFREFLLARIRFWVQTNYNNEKETPSWLPLPLKTAQLGVLFEHRMRRLYEAGEVDVAEAEAKQTIVVTYAIRKSETSHGTQPGAVFGIQLQGADGNNTLATMSVTAGKEPPLLRQVGNEGEVISHIAKLTDRWASSMPRGTVKLSFRAVDFATLSFDDQLAIAQSTDVFIGPHGAVFAYLLYLRKMPHASVLELKPPERGSGNQQFHNLSKRLGHEYEYAGIGKTVSSLQMKSMEQALEILLDRLHQARSKSIA